MTGEFYTYFHTRNDTGKVFYVGKGKGRRAHQSSRNHHWHNIVAKHGYTVHFAMTGLSEAEAFEHERFLILCFKDMGIKLTNMTNGGEGASGYIQPPEVREKHRQTFLKDGGESLRKANAKRRAIGIPHHHVGRVLSKEDIQAMLDGNPSRMKGKRQSDEAKAKISAASSGERNPMYGKTFTHTEEAKQKISKASKNRVVTPEARLNIAAAAKAAWARRKANNGTLK